MYDFDMDKIEQAKFSVLDTASFWMHVKKISCKSKFATRYGMCWEWQGALFSSGYGHFICHTISYRAHRIAFYLFNGTISKDKFICHLCDNPKCVNPHHLFEGTAQNNMLDRDTKGRIIKSGRRKDQKSKYHGVFYRKDNDKWRIIIMINYKQMRFGQFENEIDAAKEYDKIILNLNKDLKEKDRFKLNFPDLIT